jgi:RNA polymerase sigma-70 factor (ECF subfamily)
LLESWRAGNQEALASLIPLLYAKLRTLASGLMRSERANHTLTPTAIVNEAYLRLHDTNLPWQDRAHFLAIAAREMRRVLVDHARLRQRDKRGGDWQRVTFTGLQEAQASEVNIVDMIAIETALDKLTLIDPRKTQVVDLLLFGGLTIAEISELLQLSVPTINRDWKFARAFLQHELKSLEQPAPEPA